MARAPARPADVAGALDAGAATLGCGLGAAQRQALLDYLALLVKWNRVYNLTAVRDPLAMVTQHLLDSLAVVAPLQRRLGEAPARLLDVGSGAGLPGVVVAALLPQVDVTCVDAVGKKASFVREVAGALRLVNLHAVHARVETLEAPPFDVITARAFASLADFVTPTRRHLAAGGVWMAMKGRAPADEIAALPADTEVFHVEPLEVPGLDAERCLVWMRHR
jgi:16S rRNA (guanine527-N7)-methyltransferase